MIYLEVRAIGYVSTGVGARGLKNCCRLCTALTFTALSRTSSPRVGGRPPGLLVELSTESAHEAHHESSEHMTKACGFRSESPNETSLIRSHLLMMSTRSPRDVREPKSATIWFAVTTVRSGAWHHARSPSSQHRRPIQVARSG